ncbi:MAG: methyltransferase domain-containing protein [Cyanobacteria bacterium P01_D01_bin.1]
MVWNAPSYQDQFSYVWQHGEGLLSQLNPQAGERIVDLGCGTGQLTAQIAMSGAEAIGLDYDHDMIAQAQANYPQLNFQVANAEDFRVPSPVDAVFSNAALHWVQQPEAAARSIAAALKPKGRLVAEFGGKGNIQTILTALEEVSGQNNLSPWYFPSVGEYSVLLESAGLEVIYISLFERPTALGEAGLAGWLEMFSQRLFSNLSPSEWFELVKAVEAKVPQLYRLESPLEDRKARPTEDRKVKNQKGGWIADYRRLRVVAVKI